MAKSKPEAAAAPETPALAPEASAPVAVEVPKPEPVPAPEASAPVAVEVPVWRTFALCQRGQTVAFQFGTVVYVGGELEEDPQRVETLRSCDGFELVEVYSEEHADSLRADLARIYDELSRAASRIGYKLARHGDRIERR